MQRNAAMTKPTLKDVARAAGVSQMTASRALRHAHDVSKPSLQKVETAARKLGYVPNRIAGALASRRVNLVGVVFPSLSSFVFPEVLSGITSALESSVLQPVVGVSGYDPKVEEQVIRDMLSWRPAGMIVAGLEHSPAARRMLAMADIPVVEIMDTDGNPVDYCVGISHHLAGHKMARAIVAKGYRQIGFIGTKMPKDYRAQKRLAGFVAGLKEAGISLADQQLYTGGSTLAKGRELTAGLLGQHPDINCVYYSSDVMSAGGLMHCLTAGLSVPGDLAIAGFNGLDLLDGLPVRLATTNAHRTEIGRMAAGIVEQGARPDQRRIIALDPTIDLGESL